MRANSCDARGRLRLPEAWVNARARVALDAATRDRGLALLRRKYGWQLALTDFASRLTGRIQRRAWIEIAG